MQCTSDISHKSNSGRMQISINLTYRSVQILRNTSRGRGGQSKNEYVAGDMMM